MKALRECVNRCPADPVVRTFNHTLDAIEQNWRNGKAEQLNLCVKVPNHSSKCAKEERYTLGKARAGFFTAEQADLLCTVYLKCMRAKVQLNGTCSGMTNVVLSMADVEYAMGHFENAPEEKMPER